MRFYFYIRRLLGFNFLTFIVITVGLCVLGLVFLEAMLGRWVRLAYPTLVVVTFSVFLTLIGFSLLQVVLHQRRSRAKQDIAQEWLESLSSYAWSNTPLTVRPSPKDVRAAYALLGIFENLEGLEAARLQGLYKDIGFLHRDLQILQGRSSVQQRSNALVRLGKLCHPEAIPTLQRELEFDGRPLRNLTFLVLAKTHGRIYCDGPDLISRLGPYFEFGGFSRGVLEEALTLMGVKAEPLLRHFLLDSSPQFLTQIALNVIGRSGWLAWAEDCAMFLYHLGPELRAASLRALANLHYIPTGREEDVIALLQDPVWFVRVQAAHACVAVPDDDVHEHLWEALGDPTWWVRHSAANCLSKRGSTGREVLEMAVKIHPDKYARDISLQTLV
jgi:hypothetical protein